MILMLVLVVLVVTIWNKSWLVLLSIQLGFQNRLVVVIRMVLMHLASCAVLMAILEMMVDGGGGVGDNMEGYVSRTGCYIDDDDHIYVSCIIIIKNI